MMDVVEETSVGDAVAQKDRAEQDALRARGEIPSHVAIIMDGNGRWARERGHHRAFGHGEGVVSVRDITEAAVQIGISYLTLYTFSTENWQRPSDEVNSLMELLVHTIRMERETLLRNSVRLNAIGDLDMLPPACRAELEDTIAATASGSSMALTLALSYSGRWEIVQAARRVAAAAVRGEIAPEAIDDEAFARELCTAGSPDPELLIRTGGEMRISNFLLWQLAYTEIFVTDVFWPEFRRHRLYEAVKAYQDRERRFGRVL